MEPRISCFADCCCATLRLSASRMRAGVAYSVSPELLQLLWLPPAYIDMWTTIPVPRPGAVRTSNCAPSFSALACMLDNPKPSMHAL